MSDPVQCHANADSAVAIRSPIRFPLPRRASLASVRRTSPHPRHATQLRGPQLRRCNARGTVHAKLLR